MNDHVFLDFMIEDMQNGNLSWEPEGNGYIGMWNSRWSRGSKEPIPVHVMQIGNEYEWAYCTDLGCMSRGRTMANSKVYKLVKLIRRSLGEQSKNTEDSKEA
jgi:hypothetical protein